ncbi:iron-containing alcohol dehydrogenase [soil metagenome]
MSGGTRRPAARDEGLVQAFGIDVPTRVRFGHGSRRAVGTVAAAYGQRTVLVTGASFAANPAAADVLTALGEAGVTIAEHVTVQGEPDDPGVLALVRRLEAVAPDSITAVGGGSPLDLAKAAALRPSPERLAALLAGERTEMPGIPVIALPTTAGSGAEVSHAAIILDRGAGRKRGVRGRGVAAREALVDPELMVGAPPRVAAAAGFDAIAHAVETSASRAASPFVLALGGAALPRLFDAVPRLVGNPAGADPWSDAAYAAMLMGINLANSTTCLPHRLQYPVGAATGTAHALGVAALFPAWLERTVAIAPASLARLARAAGLVADGDADAAAAAMLAEMIAAHLDATGMRLRLSDLGVRAADLDDLVSAVEGSVANDPGPSTTADLRDLYAASL